MPPTSNKIISSTMSDASLSEISPRTLAELLPPALEKGPSPPPPPPQLLPPSAPPLPGPPPPVSATAPMQNAIRGFWRPHMNGLSSCEMGFWRATLNFRKICHSAKTACGRRLYRMPCTCRCCRNFTLYCRKDSIFESAENRNSQHGRVAKWTSSDPNKVLVIILSKKDFPCSYSTSLLPNYSLKY